MPSFRIGLTPSKRAAGRFIVSVRRSLLKALAEEQAKRGLTQTQIAQIIGVHRSVINRELRGQKDITLGRVAELASALGRRATLTLPEVQLGAGSNVSVRPPAITSTAQQVKQFNAPQGFVTKVETAAATRRVA